MVAPSVVQSVSSNASAAVETATFAATPTTGNVIVLAATMDQGATFTFEPGFNALNLVENTGDVSTQVAWRVATTETTAAYVVNASRSDNIVVVGVEYQDIDTSAPIDVTGTNVTTATNTYTPAPVTTGGDDRIVHLFVGADRFAVVTTPAGYADVNSRDGGSVTLLSYTRTVASQGTESPGDFAFGVGNNEDWAGYTIAFQNTSGAPAPGYPSPYYDGTIVGNNPGVG